MDTSPEADFVPFGGDEEPSSPANGSSDCWANGSSNMCGVLNLDRHEASVGESVQVEWRIDSVGGGHGPALVPSERDWIGLFQAGRHYKFKLAYYSSV